MSKHKEINCSGFVANFNFGDSKINTAFVITTLAQDLEKALKKTRAKRRRTARKTTREGKVGASIQSLGHTSVITGSSGSGVGVTDNDIHKSRSSSWLEM